MRTRKSVLFVIALAIVIVLGSVVMAGSSTAYMNSLKVRKTIWIWKPGEYGIKQAISPLRVAFVPNTQMIYVTNQKKQH